MIPKLMQNFHIGLAALQYKRQCWQNDGQYLHLISSIVFAPVFWLAIFLYAFYFTFVD